MSVLDIRITSEAPDRAHEPRSFSFNERPHAAGQEVEFESVAGGCSAEPAPRLPRSVATDGG
jgi:hypothetical protein